MPLFDFLAESKIAAAISRGELDDLPGSGRPLELDDDPLVPEELRMAYRTLKNAGYLDADDPENGFYDKLLARLGRLRKV